MMGEVVPFRTKKLTGFIADDIGISRSEALRFRHEMMVKSNKLMKDVLFDDETNPDSGDCA